MRGLLVVFVAVLGVATAARGDPPPPAPEAIEATCERARTALKSRADALLAAWTARPPDLSEHGQGRMALACLAMLRAGVPPVDLDPHFEWMSGQPFHWTYDVSLYLLAVEARGVLRVPSRPAPSGGARDAGRGGRAGGEEQEGTRVRRRRPELPVAPGPIPQHVPAGLTAKEEHEVARAARWLLAVFHARTGTWAYGGPIGEGWWSDHSNTQFAVHGLAAAARAGFDVPLGVWRRVLDHFVAAQEEREPGTVSLADVTFAEGSPLGTWLHEDGASDARLEGRAGGWSYVPGHHAGPNSSMSAAGLFCLATAFTQLEAQGGVGRARRPKALRALRDGVAWFRRHYAFAMPLQNQLNTHGYHLLSALKALTATGVVTLGGKDWWNDGARRIVAGGGWGEEIEGSFRLLWLNRGVIVPGESPDPVPPPRVRTGEDRDEPPPPPDWDLVAVGGGPVQVTGLLRDLARPDVGAVPRRLAEARAAVDAMPPTDRLQVLPEVGVLLGAEHSSIRRFAEGVAEELVGSDRAGVVGAIHHRWAELRRLTVSGDPDAVAEARAVLHDRRTPRLLRRAALDALARQRAAEAVPDVLAELEGADRRADAGYRVYAAWVLRAIAGDARPYDVDASRSRRRKQLEAWRAFWDEEGEAFAREVRLRQAAAALADPMRRGGAARTLREGGDDAVPFLVAALTAAAARARAGAVLRELTGADLPDRPAPWLRWLREQDRPPPPRLQWAGAPGLGTEGRLR